MARNEPRPTAHGLRHPKPQCTRLDSRTPPKGWPPTPAHLTQSRRAQVKSGTGRSRQTCAFGHRQRAVVVLRALLAHVAACPLKGIGGATPYGQGEGVSVDRGLTEGKPPRSTTATFFVSCPSALPPRVPLTYVLSDPREACCRCVRVGWLSKAVGRLNRRLDKPRLRFAHDVHPPAR